TVKRLSADDSADSRVKVGHRQALTALKKPLSSTLRGFLFGAAQIRDVSARPGQMTDERLA
ncbi:hypothetical protein, partial [uncultured Pseudacidovorax sp.]|uniref:hypothetical protein n=1 Tax=uncultured Pseudacidovorax sp. TaxID=679313 RepID=UPI0025DC1367